MSKRLTEGSLQLNEMENINKKSMAENSELFRQLEEIEGKKRRLLAKTFCFSI